MQKAYIVYDGRVFDSFEYELKVEPVELLPANGWKQYAPGRTTWKFTDLVTGLIVEGEGRPQKVVGSEDTLYYIL